MTKTERPLNFKDADHRDTWIMDNASYFTVVQRKNRAYQRLEKPTLAEAEELARALIREDNAARLLIYAVHDQMSAYIKTMHFGD